MKPFTAVAAIVSATIAVVNGMLTVAAPPASAVLTLEPLSNKGMAPADLIALREQLLTVRR